MRMMAADRRFHSTGKGSPCPSWPCKVRPQAVLRKIILAFAGSGIFRKNPAQPGHGPLPARGMKSTVMNHSLTTTKKQKIMDLNRSEVSVTTQHLIDMRQEKDNWLRMSDFGDMGEFLNACSDLFPKEREPEYRYLGWEDIPDLLISREWLCPNFFDIRDALETLGGEDAEHFITWSGHYGYDLTTDDPYMMVSHYLDLYGHTLTEPEEDPADMPAGELIYTGVSSNYLDMAPYRYEIFDDDYN